MHWPWERAKENLSEELEAHLQMAIAERVAERRSPAQARAAALREFGNMPLIEDVTRARWGWMWLENLLWDIRYAARSLSTVRGYTATLACYALALGLGCVTTMLAIVQSVLLGRWICHNRGGWCRSTLRTRLRGLPPRRMQSLTQPSTRCGATSFSLTGVGGYNTMVLPVETADGARVNPLMEVIPGFFQVLGLSPKLGRLRSVPMTRTRMWLTSATDSGAIGYKVIPMRSEVWSRSQADSGL